MNLFRKSSAPARTHPMNASAVATPRPWQPQAHPSEPETELVCRWEPTGQDYPKMAARWVLIQKG